MVNYLSAGGREMFSRVGLGKCPISLFIGVFVIWPNLNVDVDGSIMRPIPLFRYM